MCILILPLGSARPLVHAENSVQLHQLPIAPNASALYDTEQIIKPLAKGLDNWIERIARLPSGETRRI
jgi:hypothetical protein